MFPSSELAADLAACRAMLRTGSRSFHAAARLLPARVADPAVALYAFCRLADDAVDGGRDGKAQAVERLHLRLARAYDGRPAPHPADRALAETVRRFALPSALPEALLEGLVWDAAGRRYDDLSGLLDYAARVAGSVGAMMAVIMGASGAAAAACDLGMAMQLTNIARDVGEDAREGRLYLPLHWMREFGIDPDAFLADPAWSPELACVVARLLEVADSLYARGERGIGALPLSCRPAIRAARLLYAEIGRQVERNGSDMVTRRAVVPGRRKAVLLARAVLGAAVATRDELPRPLPQTMFLVRAAQEGVMLPRRRRGGVRGRALWVLDLFEQLQRRDVLTRVRP